MNPIELLLGIGSKVIDRVFPDPAQRAAAQLELFKLQQNGELSQMTAQLAVNQEEAKSSNVFVSGWRPFIGWVCGICVAIYYIPQFILAAYLWLTLCVDRGFIVPYPIDPTSLMELVYLILGFGAYRSIEKLTGTNKR